MIFESHAHFNDNKFKEYDMDELAKKMSDAGIKVNLNFACEEDDFEDVIALTNKYDEFYAGVGVHPHSAKDVSNNYLQKIEDALKLPKVVCLGEIGLDYHYDFSPRSVQKKVFIEQLNLAKKLNVPICIHSREACADTLEIVKKYGHGNGVVHCFSGSVETAREYVKLGYKIGIDGPITYKNSKISDVVREVGIDNILIETDSPYLSPRQKRGTTNTSLNLVYIVEKISEVLDIEPEEVEEATFRNGEKLFGISV